MITLSYGESALAICALGTLLAYGTDDGDADWPCLIEIITKIRGNYDALLDGEDVSIELTEYQQTWFDGAMSQGICFFSLFDNANTEALRGLMNAVVSTDVKEEIEEYLTTRKVPASDTMFC
jgi:hypothetical protein